MTIAPGTTSALALVAVGLRFDVIVQALMRELGLTHAEATRAAFEARHGLQDVDRPGRANA